MRALFKTENSDELLAWRDVPSPQLQHATDAIVRPVAVAACDLDRSIALGQPVFPGEFMLGHEFCAEVLEVGDEVCHLSQGDLVLASFQPSCGACPRCSRALSSVCGAVPNGTMYGIGATGGDWGGAYADSIRVPWAGYNLRALSLSTNPATLASASDNFADGLRGVDGPLRRNPGAGVLIAGSGSIPLYAVICAKFLGAGSITVASADEFVLDTAAALGADCLPVDSDRWPKRFASFDITVDCTNQTQGLSCVLQSTAPYGECTSSSIFFGGPIAVPMFNLNMRGISFHTGRVNSAGQLDRVLELVNAGIDLDQINPAYVGFADVAQALVELPFSQKVIATPA